MKKILLIVALLIFVVIADGVVFAAGSTEMPGAYTAPQIKTDSAVDAFFSELAKQPSVDKALKNLSEDQGEPADRILVTKLTIEGDDPFHADPNNILARYLGHRFTVSQLNSMTEILTYYYRQHDYPATQVYLPKQEIANGAVKFALLIGRYGKISLNNFSQISDSAIMRQAYAISEGGYITSSGMEKALLLINDLALASAKAEISAGSTPGTSDLKIIVAPDGLTKYGGSVNADNVGSQYTGQYELGVGLYVNNLSGNADSLALNGQAGYQPNDKNFNTYTGAISYRMPTALFNGDIGISASYVNYFIGGAFAALDYRGNAIVESLRWNYALQRSQLANQNLQVIVNGKQLSDSQIIVGTSSQSQVTEASLIYGGDWVSGGIYTGLTTYSIGVTGGTWQNNGQVNPLYVLNNGPLFGFVNGDIYHQARFTNEWSADVDVSGQYAANNLNPTDKFTLGGYSGVKAFAQGAAAGDRGALGKLNVRYNLPRTDASWLPDWQLILFSDAGMVGVNTMQASQTTANQQAIGDYGAGIAMYVGNSFKLEIDYAQKLFYWDNLSGSDTDQGEGNSNVLVHLAYSF